MATAKKAAKKPAAKKSAAKKPAAKKPAAKKGAPTVKEKPKKKQEEEVYGYIKDSDLEDKNKPYIECYIIIGKGAARLKEIGIQARHDIEHLVGHRCHLELFVKVEKDWRDKEHMLDGMGVN